MVYWIYISLALPYFGIVVDTILLNVCVFAYGCCGDAVGSLRGPKSWSTTSRSYAPQLVIYFCTLFLLFAVSFVIQTQAKSYLTLSLREAIKNNDIVS